MSYFAASIEDGELQEVDMTEQTRDVLEALWFLRDTDRPVILADALEEYALAHASDPGVDAMVQLRSTRRAIR